MAKLFSIVVKRAPAEGNLVPGKIWVDDILLGKTYENGSVMIPVGAYRGTLRYRSNHNFVQGPGGHMGKSGDFLIEIGGVTNRTNILFHGGNKPRHSLGCILLGPISSRIDKVGNIIHLVDTNSVLAKLRRSFYGGDNPVSCPDSDIQVSVR